MSALALFRSRVIPLVSVVGLAGSPSVEATGSSAPKPKAPERVFVTSVDNKILEVDFANGTTSTVVRSNGSNFQGLAVRNDLHLAVADHNGGGRVKLFNTAGQGQTISSAIAFPSGVTVEGGQRLYVTNERSGKNGKYSSSWGDHSSKSAGVWRLDRDYAACLDGTDPLSCANAGYRPAVAIDSPVKVGGAAVRELADVKAAGGRLYVLAAEPSLLLVYGEPATCASPCPKQVAIDTAFFEGLTPSGLAFTGSEILVATAEGRILRFDLAKAGNGQADDHALEPDFANGCGRVERIAVGLQGGEPRVFVTLHPRAVQQYSIQASGVGTLLKTVGGVQSPVGVSLASAGAEATAVGDGTEVVMNSIEATFETVTKPGLSDAWCVSFVDPRETAATLAEPEAPLAEDLLLTDPRLPADVRNLGYPNKIPRYVRAFRRGLPGETEDNASGPPTFRFCQATTTAEFKTLVRVMGESEPRWLGYDPACNNESPWLRPRFFYSEEPPEPVLSEGRVFINNTSMCNRDTNDSWKMKSIYVTGARETRPGDNRDLRVKDAELPSGECDPAAGVVDCQLNRLRAVLKSQACIKASFKSSLLGLLDAAIDRFDCGSYTSAKEKLAYFEKKVRCEEARSYGAFSGCGTSEVSGELRSRARGAIFGLCDGLGAGPCPCNQVAQGHDDDLEFLSTHTSPATCTPVPACGY